MPVGTVLPNGNYSHIWMKVIGLRSVDFAKRVRKGLTRSFKDKQGDVRHEVRLRWWDPDATSFPIAALGMDGDEETLLDLPVTTEYQYTEVIPVLFGHYWLKGTPIISGRNAACLDFSVAKEGFLTAYRWSGETVLSQKNVVYVKA